MECYSAGSSFFPHSLTVLSLLAVAIHCPFLPHLSAFTSSL